MYSQINLTSATQPWSPTKITPQDKSTQANRNPINYLQKNKKTLQQRDSIEATQKNSRHCNYYEGAREPGEQVFSFIHEAFFTAVSHNNIPARKSAAAEKSRVCVRHPPFQLLPTAERLQAMKFSNYTIFYITLYIILVTILHIILYTILYIIVYIRLNLLTWSITSNHHVRSRLDGTAALVVLKGRCNTFTNRDVIIPTECCTANNKTPSKLKPRKW